jgi:hypothetical protein
MTTIGKYRCRKLFKQNKRCACHIHNSTIENLPVVIRKKKFGLQKGHRLVFFPFNCFGNIRNLKKIMQVLKLLKADVFISTYRSDSIASEIRGRYYRQCGYAGVICKRTNKGHIVKSQKELYSYAYNQQYLEMLCKEANLRLAKIFQLSNIGVGYLFKHI